MTFSKFYTFFQTYYICMKFIIAHEQVKDIYILSLKS